MATLKNGKATAAKHPKRKREAIPPPAYFLSLTVANMRCFTEEQTLDLSDGNGRPAQWTVILGENGIGKTTLLQGLAMLEPKYWQDDSTTARMIANPATWEHQWAAIRDKKNAIKIEASIAIEGTLRGTNQDYKTIPISRISALQNLSLKSRGVVEGQEGKSTLHSYNRIGGLVCYGYGALRQIGRSSLSKERDDATASLFSDEPLLINAEEWLLQTDYSYKSLAGTEKKKAKLRLDSIRGILLDILPDVEDLRFTQPDIDTSKHIRVEFLTPYGWVSLQQLGLGYKTMIAWVVDLAARLWQRYPKSPNPLAEPAVVLVDEIDLHLHPRWQRNLISYLSERFPNTQFIVTAHSPLIVQAAENANIVLLQRHDDHVVIESHVQVQPNLRIDQLLTSELFGLESARSPKLAKLLTQRTAILAKSALTKKDEKELAILQQQIGLLPTADTPEDREAMDIIRRAAQLVQKHSAT